ncbi:MAG: hypothetical protein CV087_24405, partial [Candidatus Brocadia sp. WS118]
KKLSIKRLLKWHKKALHHNRNTTPAYTKTIQRAGCSHTQKVLINSLDTLVARTSKACPCFFIQHNPRAALPQPKL